MPSRHSRLAALLITGLVAACGRAEPAGPVRTPEQARGIAERSLKAAGLDEEVIATARQGQAWIVTTRWRESSVAGHLVTVDAATGKVTFERYRTLELGPPR